jgi:hypothetical protein
VQRCGPFGLGSRDEGSEALDGLPKYQLALSYAARDRDYVEPFAAELEKRGVVFFDPWTAPEVLGEYAPAELQRIYQEDTQHVILFISESYVSDLATKPERRAALDRALEVDAFALPARFDNSAVPGLSPNVRYERVSRDGRRGLAPAQFADRVVAWLKAKDGGVRRAGAPAAAPLSGWERFDPASFHVLVVESESESPDGRGELSRLLNLVLSREIGQAWNVVRDALREAAALDGIRDLPEEFTLDAVHTSVFSTAAAMASPAALDTAVRLLIEADLVLIDVTHFEPGVMLLLGVRAATRRGVTVASYGDDWIEGTPLQRPFNLADLSLAAHSPVRAPGAGEDPRIHRMAVRLRTGFYQLRGHRGYLDLPVYDALRQTDADPSAWVPIPPTDEILVLCTYAPQFHPTWTSLQYEIVDAMLARKITGMSVLRMQDFATPQVVSQALYERIRRCVACIVDWSHASPSTFFELGVRLISSPWGTVQIASQRWLDQLDQPAGTADDAGGRVPPHRQIHGMLEIFEPIAYDVPVSSEVGGRIAEALMAIGESAGKSGHHVRDVAIAALERVEPRVLDVAAELQVLAAGLDSQEHQRSVPQSLFYEAQAMKRDRERGARERRVAAWLYLHHRMHAGDRGADGAVRERWLELGNEVAEALQLSGDEADVDLGLQISQMLESE